MGISNNSVLNITVVHMYTNWQNNTSQHKCTMTQSNKSSCITYHVSKCKLRIRFINTPMRVRMDISPLSHKYPQTTEALINRLRYKPAHTLNSVSSLSVFGFKYLVANLSSSPIVYICPKWSNYKTVSDGWTCSWKPWRLVRWESWAKWYDSIVSNLEERIIQLP